MAKESMESEADRLLVSKIFRSGLNQFLDRYAKDFLTQDLFDWLAHGDSKHKMWLHQAIYAYFNELDKPDVV